MTKASDAIKVPTEATGISSPLILRHWTNLLAAHPDRPLVNFFLAGIAQGFRIGYHNPQSSLKSAKRNLACALQHPEVIDCYLDEELALQRLAGPFQKEVVPEAHISRFGVIPKQHQPGKWRLIVDLSHPSGHSVNDGIPKPLCSLSYITVDSAIAEILKLGRGALLAKVDIKSAFRLLSVHPADRHLLAMTWNEQIYIDTCLPFGLRSAPKLFNILAEFLSWILEQKGVRPLLHYLDDFLIISPAMSPSCSDNLQIIREVCSHLGIPLAVEKIEGPSEILTFLGITLDTHSLEARLPPSKLQRIRNEVKVWLKKKNATKKSILSLVGLLQHATKVVKPGRTFVSRMYATAAKMRKLSHRTRLTMEFKSDLRWWDLFITSWNGISFLYRCQETSFDHQIWTDASGAWGCGAQFGDQWFQFPWPLEWKPITIMAKELVPIIFSCSVWGRLLSRKRVQFFCDNLGLVKSIQKGASKDNIVMHLLRCLWFFTAHHDIHITACHLPGVQNMAADLLSRNKLQQFLISQPTASHSPTPIPPCLARVVSPRQLDWTSSQFLRHFRQVIQMLQ